MTRKYTWFFKPTIHNFICILAGIFINVLGGSITYSLHAPIWLNSIGTILCSCFLGPIAGGITGILATILCHINTPFLWAYSIASIPISISISLLYQRTKLRDTFQLVCFGVFIMMFSTIISVPLNMLLRDGYIGNIWGDALITMLIQNGNTSLFYCILGQLFIELPDKILSVFVAYFLIKLFDTISKKTERRRIKK